VLKLPVEIKIAAERQEKIFRKDIFDKRLKTHKLSGVLKNYWAFTIDYKHRIVFSFLDSQTVKFHIIGDHSIYRQ